MLEIFDFLNGSSSINVFDVLINVVLSMLLSQLVYVVFINYGNTFSNRRQFGKIFLLITVSTTLIISIIQASLALSLGLVGALSIVRFRTAIKEPEELAYAFFAITVGIGCGANARGLTISCCLLVMAVLAFRGMIQKKGLSHDTYNFNIVTKQISLSDINSLIANNTVTNSMRRSDINDSTINVQYIVNFEDIKQLERLNDKLKARDPKVITSYISNSTFV